MLIAGLIPIRERYRNTYIRPSEVPGSVVLDIIQLFYKQKGLWDENEQVAKYFIGSQNAVALSIPSQKPAILVQRGVCTFSNLGGINQRLYRDMKTGAESYTDLLRTSVMVHCLDINPGMCESLGADMFELFGMLRHEHKNFGLFKIENIQLSELRKLKESVRPDNWVMFLSFETSMQITWRVEQVASTLKSLVVDVVDVI